MRTYAVVLTMLAAGLAGCIGTGGDETISPETTDLPSPADLPLLPDGTPAPASVTLAGCTEQLGAFPTPPMALGPIPEGFALESFDPAGATVTSVAITLSCTYGEDEVVEMYGGYPVAPPADLVDPEADVHILIFGAWTTSQALLDVYEAWGVADLTSLGDVSLETIGAPVGEIGHALGTGDGFTVHVYTAVAGETGTQPGGKARVFTMNGDGELTGVLDVAWTESMQLVDGVAELRFEGGLNPFILAFGQVNPGIGMHFWGEEYALTYEYVDLAGLEADA